MSAHTPCSCGDPSLAHVMGAAVTHTPERCGFTTGPVEHLRIEAPDGISKDDMVRQVVIAKRQGCKS